MASRFCPICATEFHSNNARKRYCSRSCRDKGKPSASGLSCSVCGGRMTRSSTSASQGSAMHNKCAPTGGHVRGCKCDCCREILNRRAREYRAKRKAAGMPLPSGDRWISMASRNAIYLRDEGICQLCFVPVDFDAHYMSQSAPTLDHIIPRSHGGSDDPENLRLACRGCNCSRSNRLDWEAVHVSV